MADDKIRVHIHLFQSDWDAIGVIFGNSIGKSEAVRTIVHNFIKRLSSQSARKETPVELSTNELDHILSGVTPGRDQPS
jgi:hypothetical protein